MQRPRSSLFSAGGQALSRLSQPRVLAGSSLLRCQAHLWVTAPPVTGAILVQRAHVHESPFIDIPSDVSRGEAYEVARDALLQLNVMIRRGIEPDALMYTSLIDTMGRAGLEWQAYKLFSRMVEQNVRPLPETYVALRDATAKSRVKLREDIQAKIEETMQTLPQELAEDVAARQREEDRQCVAKFSEYMRGEVPAVAASASSSAATPSDPPTAAEAVQAGEESAHRAADEGKDASAPAVATVHIRHPTDVWNTARFAEELRGAPQQRASGTAAEGLREALNKLHDEELRIYLAAQRQLRHGTHEVLVQRVLDTVGERAIRDMLARRQHYFRSVEEILANDLRELRMSGASAEKTPSSGATHEGDRTLRASEKEEVAPEVLHTPWGILRKPSRPAAEPPAPRSLERLERVRLSDPELVLVRQRSSTKDLDELPESLLRRYAYQFQLRWRRRDPLSLLEAVQWHATTFLSQAALAAGEAAGALPGASPTPAVRLQREAEGMQQTLENFEAFRVISQRTNNLQVVDNKEINLQLKRVRQEAQRKERKAEERLRRERNVMAAAGLAASARSFTLSPDDSDAESHVLGLGNGASGTRNSTQDDGVVPTLPGPSSAAAESSSAAPTSADGENPVEELPPWALFDGEDEFNLTTGRFGSAEMGRYRELSDSKFQVLPSRAAQQQWSVDRQLLPSTLQDVVRQAELELKARHDSVEQEYEEKLHYKRYRRWDQMIQKAQNKKKKQRQRGRGTSRGGDEAGVEGEEDAVKPLPPRRRLSQLLRKGADRDRVPERVREKFNRGL